MSLILPGVTASALVPVSNTYTLIGHTFFAGGANGGTTPAINTTGSDLIICGVMWAAAPQEAPTDSKSNTWVALNTQVTSNVGVKLYYCDAPTVGSGHTFSSTGGTGNYEAIYVMAFSGSILSPFDQQSGTTTGGSFTAQPGSITPASHNELLIVICGNEGSASQAVNSSYTITDSSLAGGGARGGGMAYLIQTDAAASNPTWTSSANGNNAIALASFKSKAS